MTRIAVSASEDKGLDSMVSVHFGRCPYFVLVDFEQEEVKTTRAVPNPYYQQHQPGQVPGFIHSQQVDVMLTGGMGGRAIAFFEQYGIQAATGASGTVRHALAQYVGHQLQEAEPCHESVEHGHGEGGE
jgi:predicted Fe-Mo cluster-binding NifX family protein